MQTSLFALMGLGFGEFFVVMVMLLFVSLPVCATIVAVVFLLRRRNASAQRLCPKCGAPLAANRPEGLCPACLLRVGLETRTGVEPGFPAREELARAFPQLEILDPLGRGGMGMVWKARQAQLDRFVALKVLSPQLSKDPAFAERFAREAKALAHLSHPNIVSIFDFGQTGGFYYFVMEYMDGESLWHRERDRKPVPPGDAKQIASAVCDALQYAHDAGVVHRDIKPANILFDKTGRMKLADFGVAKLVWTDVTGLGLTEPRAALGTPYYMAPEQWEAPHNVDHRADIYSLGAVVYEMLSGELPLGRFPPPSRKMGINGRWDELVFRALEKDPALRYPQASQFKTAMADVI